MIGIIDSGIGGKVIEVEIKKIIPGVKIEYLADTKNFPYGLKSVEELNRILKDNVDLLISRGVKMIVLACNSATVSSIVKLRSVYKSMPIIGTVPAIKPACELTKTKKIAVFATSVTCQSQAVKDLIEEFGQGVEVSLIPFKKLASQIEKGQIDLAIENVKNVWENYENMDIDVVVLGCTHYSIIENEIQKIVGPHVQLVDLKKSVAEQVKKIYNGIKF